MKRLILAGGSGFLGQELAHYFAALNWEIIVLTRSPRPSPGPARDVAWDARTLGAWRRELEGAAAVVNLTGRSVNCRYNTCHRREILESRVDSTRILGQAIAQCVAPAPVWLNASTATLYKHTFGPAWDESGATEAVAGAKDAFSVEVGKAWEAALAQAATPRTRKIPLRMSLVLGRGQNSVYPVLRHLARFGLGGKMGRGDQYVSWIHATDYCRALHWLIEHPELSGPVNVVGPQPVPNREMMRLLRQSCGAPFGLPAAEWMLEIGAFILRTETELLLKSRRVVPDRLLRSGFVFHFPTLAAALDDLAHHPS